MDAGYTGDLRVTCLHDRAGEMRKGFANMLVFHISNGKLSQRTRHVDVLNIRLTFCMFPTEMLSYSRPVF